MGIPTQTEMYHHVFLFMATNPKEYSRSEIKEHIAAILGLSGDERKYLTGSGVPVYQSRIGWAISHLSDAQLIDRPSRGVYCINEHGKIIYGQKMGQKELALYLRSRKRIDPLADEGDCCDAEEDLSPVELIDKSVSEVNAQVGRELLDRILSMDPQFFEQLTVDLVEKMGYGRGAVTRYVADGGIDGIVVTDTLGFDPIFIQAKRYDPATTVGRPVIQAFAGAMNEVTRGVFVTTAKYSKEAREFALRYKHGTIKLLDGTELTRLMMQVNLGVTDERAFKIKRLDVDYFENA